MVICLELGADDLHMVQLMPLPPLHLLFDYSPDWFIVFYSTCVRMSYVLNFYLLT